MVPRPQQVGCLVVGCVCRLLLLLLPCRQTRLLVVTTGLELTLQDGSVVITFDAITGLTNMDTGAYGALQVCGWGCAGRNCCCCCCTVCGAAW